MKQVSVAGCGVVVKDKRYYYYKITKTKAQMQYLFIIHYSAPSAPLLTESCGRDTFFPRSRLTTHASRHKKRSANCLADLLFSETDICGGIVL